MFWLCRTRWGAAISASDLKRPGVERIAAAPLAHQAPQGGRSHRTTRCAGGRASSSYCTSVDIVAVWSRGCSPLAPALHWAAHRVRRSRSRLCVAIPLPPRTLVPVCPHTCAPSRPFADHVSWLSNSVRLPDRTPRPPAWGPRVVVTLAPSRTRNALAPHASCIPGKTDVVELSFIVRLAAVPRAPRRGRPCGLAPPGGGRPLSTRGCGKSEARVGERKAGGGAAAAPSLGGGSRRGG
jgi:hypothetical protein